MPLSVAVKLFEQDGFLARGAEVSQPLSRAVTVECGKKLSGSVQVLGVVPGRPPRCGNADLLALRIQSYLDDGYAGAFCDGQKSGF